MESPTIHTKAEAAVILRVTESWLERHAAARKIPFTMLGGAYHFTAEHITEIVRMNEKLPAIGESERPKPTRGVRRPVSRGNVAPLRPRPRQAGPRHVA